MVKFRVISRFLVFLCIPSLLPVAESDDTVDCSTDSRGFIDDVFAVNCPAGCSPYHYSRRVWGTGIYRSDSSICRAAIHDGRITNAGGQVTVYRWPGQSSYQGSWQNGIQTIAISYGSWGGSFAFTRDTVTCYTDSRGFNNDIFTVTCPAGCSAIWQAYVRGTGVYRADDSSICRAAIHDGRITNAGGQVTVYRWPGQDSYRGSWQNGIQTISGFSRDSSFAFAQVCLDALGMEDGPIEDGDITASSNQESWPPSAARLNGDRAWFPSDSEPFAGSWIQVDLVQRTIVSGVITQGYDGRLNYWVKQYEVRYLNNDEVWAAVTSPTGNSMSFSGNTGPNRLKTNMFYRPIVTQKIQLHPTDWQIEPGLRMELLGCDFIASTTQPTTAMTTKSIYTSPRKTTAYASHQTVGPFTPEISSTATLFDGDHEGQKGAKASLGVGAIAGIAAAVAVVLIAMVVFVIIFLKKRQSSNNGASNVPRNAPEQRFRNPEYSGVVLANEDTAPAQDEGYTDCELYNTEDNNPYEPYNYANSGQIPGEEIPQPHDYDYATIPGESDRGVVDNVIYESSDMT